MSFIGFRKEIGNYLDENPVWPDNRPLALAEALHEFNNQDSLSEYPNAINFTSLIHDGEIMVDLGCGQGRFCSDLKNTKENIQIIGVSAHKINEAYKEKMSRVFYGLLPENTEFLKLFEKRIKLIVETYGPTSFADNPIHVLIYSALLLRKDGFFTSVSSTTKTDPCQSVFGDIRVINKIKKFFLEHLGIKISLIPTTIKSRVTDDAFYTDFIVRFRNSAHRFGFADFEGLCRMADEKIGMPKQGDVWYQPHNTNLSIKEKAYYL